jgi:CPA2 family monovalent cation:H+ antiporter-2
MTQVVGTSLLFFGLGFVFGLQWQSSLAVALALSLSSTAIVLQTYKEKGQLNTPIGQNSFSVLLFQDIAVIPMLALLPLLVFYLVAMVQLGMLVLLNIMQHGCKRYLYLQQSVQLY